MKMMKTKLVKFTRSLSKYCASSGFSRGKLPDLGWRSTNAFFVFSSDCMKKPVWPAMGVGVAVNFLAGVRMGM
jgi:hypothetical protein